MGANYGAVYLRGPRRKDVRELLQRLAEKHNTRFMLAPELRGWLAVYPQEYGLDPNVAEGIATAFDGVALHVYMHDECLLGYSYFRNRRLVDEYCSNPDYGDEVSLSEKERLRGRPELLADLLSGPEAVEELDAVLHPADGIFGLTSFALKDLARLLDLPNACTSYEYLIEEGTVEFVLRVLTIRGLWRFEHVPSLRARKSSSGSGSISGPSVGSNCRTKENCSFISRDAWAGFSTASRICVPIRPATGFMCSGRMSAKARRRSMPRLGARRRVPRG